LWAFFSLPLASKASPQPSPKEREEYKRGNLQDIDFQLITENILRHSNSTKFHVR
jgi:hypothetical protein